MSDKEDPTELKRKIDQAVRLVATVDDQTSTKRILAFVEELRHRLKALMRREQKPPEER